MRGQWFIWALVAAVGIFVLVIFNYQGQQDSLSLSDIFSDYDKESQEDKIDNIEYEFVDAPKESIPPNIPVLVSPVEPAPVAKPVSQQLAQPVPVSKVPDAVKVSPAVSKPVDFGKATSNTPIISKSVIPSADTVNAPFTIQIASFKDRESAEVTLKGIQAAGHSAYVVSKDLGAKGTWYRIYVGKFQTKEEANQKLSEIKPNYSSSFVISP